jgi:hypothetical protein
MQLKLTYSQAQQHIIEVARAITTPAADVVVTLPDDCMVTPDDDTDITPGAVRVAGAVEDGPVFND